MLNNLAISSRQLCDNW